MTYSAGDLYLVTFVEHCFNSVVQTFDEHGVDLPKRRYWTVGAAAADCEQMVVTVLQVFWGNPGIPPTEPVRCSQPRSMTLGVQILRDAAVAGPRSSSGPSAEAIMSKAIAPPADTEILMEAVATWDRTGIGVVSTFDALDAEGGLQGVVGTVTVSLL